MISRLLQSFVTCIRLFIHSRLTRTSSKKNYCSLPWKLLQTPKLWILISFRGNIVCHFIRFNKINGLFNVDTCLPKVASCVAFCFISFITLFHLRSRWLTTLLYFHKYHYRSRNWLYNFATMLHGNCHVLDRLIEIFPSVRINSLDRPSENRSKSRIRKCIEGQRQVKRIIVTFSPLFSPLWKYFQHLLQANSLHCGLSKYYFPALIANIEETHHCCNTVFVVICFCVSRCQVLS